ncbi:TraR/DksA C4-type zinc finger protein [Streptomyces sp. IB2014 016-6]|uniref:TraR/DksA family transcriptional regulator n=1 Tax=Streptomyces sp. IB2014 016-6 TaxID=2517818 RepID=UPI0011CC9624|nr:TraR/DksA C4-type zinc finger protein [Streptomyces sp. IB2014 016-6]TXL92647.1 DNA-binding protein [Streptomyces sp. IB2014 016-6]
MVAKKTAAKKTAARKAAVKKATAEATAAGKPAAKKTSATKAPERQTPATHAPAAEETAEAEPEHQAPAKKTAARKTAPPKKVAAKKAAKRAASAAEGAAEAAEQTGAKTVAAKKTASKRPTAATGATATAVPPVRGTTPPGELAVRPGEDPWTEEEVAEARAGLESEAARLNAEISASEQALAGLMRDSGDGAGDDDADTGTKNITREHEMSLAANAREMVEQTERALLRLDAGTYGLCEVCGKPIGKARMQAFPRATLCVEDKQKQERRG